MNIFKSGHPQIVLEQGVFIFSFCISTPQLNSMQVETNESVSTSHLKKQNPI